MKQAMGIIKLIIGLIGFYVLATIILKSYNSSEFAKPIQTVIKEQRLDPSAFFYSDKLYIDTIDIDVTIR